MKKKAFRVVSAFLVCAVFLSLFASCKMKEFDGDLRGRYDYDLTDYIKPGKYKGLKVYLGDTSVKASEVERSVLRNRAYYPADEWTDVAEGIPAEKGNIVGLKYQGYLDGVALTDLSNQNVEGYSIVLGTEMIFVGVDECVIGMVTGEKKTVEVTVPEPCYAYPAYAGKTLTLELEATYIQSSTLAEYNDEFVQNFGMSSVEDFEAQLTKDLNDKRPDQVENYVLTRVTMQIKDNFEVKSYPEKELGEVYDSLVASAESEAEEHGCTLADHLAEDGMTEDEFKEEMMTTAEEIVFEEMIYYYIARKEQISLSNAAFDEKAEEFAAELELSSASEFVSYMYYYYGYSEYDVYEYVWYTMVNELVTDAAVRTDKK